MRRIGWLMAILLGGLWLASEIPSTRIASQRPHRMHGISPASWRSGPSTIDARPATPPSLHPWVVAAEEALLSLLALAALPARRPQRPLVPRQGV